MTTHVGNEGYIKVGGNTVAETQNWQLDISVATVDKTALGDTFESHMTTQKSWTGSASVFWDPSDTAQGAITVGSSVSIEFYPYGGTSGNVKFTGTATVEKLTLKGSYNGMLTADASFKGNGTLTGPTTI